MKLKESENEEGEYEKDFIPVNLVGKITFLTTDRKADEK